MSTNIVQRPIVARINATFETLAHIATAPTAAGGDPAFRGSVVAAFALLLGLAWIGAFLERPITEHVIDLAIAKQLAAHSTPAGAGGATSRSLAQTYAKIVPVIGLSLLVVQQFVAAGIMTLGVMLCNGRANFGRALYIVVHTSVLTTGLAQITLGVIHLTRGPADYDSTLAMQLSMPSLAWLVPASPQIEVVLGAINPFMVWQIAILTFWLAHCTRIAPRSAAVIACLPSVLFTALAAMYASA